MSTENIDPTQGKRLAENGEVITTEKRDFRFVVENQGSHEGEKYVEKERGDGTATRYILNEGGDSE